MKVRELVKELSKFPQDNDIAITDGEQWSNIFHVYQTGRSQVNIETNDDFYSLGLKSKQLMLKSTDDIESIIKPYYDESIVSVVGSKVMYRVVIYVKRSRINAFYFIKQDRLIEVLKELLDELGEIECFLGY